MAALYTAEALSTGGGRDGHVRTTDGRVDFEMRPPKELGGSGEGANPEQLFAAGYAACFNGALQAVARAQKVTLTDPTVGARVHLSDDGKGGFQLSVELEVTLPDLDPAVARGLAEAAHQVCPYSNATRNNIEVTVTVTDD